MDEIDMDPGKDTSSDNIESGKESDEESESSWYYASEEDNCNSEEDLQDTTVLCAYPVSWDCSSPSVNELRKIIDGLESELQLRQSHQRIEELLQTAENNPIHECLLSLVGKAHRLLLCPAYYDVLQRMIKKYAACPLKPQQGPLEECMAQFHLIFEGIIQQIQDLRSQQTADDSTSVPSDCYQRKLISFLQMLMRVDHSVHSRKKCFRALIMQAECPLTNGILHWTDQLVKILMTLLQEGADPTWIPGEQEMLFDSKSCNKASALYTIFNSFLIILVEEGQLAGMLMNLLQCCLTEKYLNHREIKGTLLHALISCDWERLPENIPPSALESYLGIISQIVSGNPTSLGTVDKDGRNVLHCFISGMKEHSDMHRIAAHVMPLLQCEKLVDAIDRSGQTALHILQERVFQISHKVCEYLASSLQSLENIDIQDINGNTALHLLVKKIVDIDDLHKEIEVNQGNTFLDQLVLCLRSPINTEMQNSCGETVLHIVARNLYHRQELAQYLINVFPLLMTSKNVNATDNLSATPYSWILACKNQQYIAPKNVIQLTKPRSIFEDVCPEMNFFRLPKPKLIIEDFSSEVNLSSVPGGRNDGNKKLAFNIEKSVSLKRKTELEISRIEKEFIRNYADDGITNEGLEKHAVYFTFQEIFHGIIRGPKESSSEDRMMDILRTDGNFIIKRDPSILCKIAEKANCFTNYKTIMQVMVSFYEQIPNKSEEESQLKCIVQQFGSHLEDVREPIKIMSEDDDETPKRYSLVKNIIYNIRNPEDVNGGKEDKILEFLRTDGTLLFNRNPHLFLKMVEKANCMIDSEKYLTIMKVMASFYASSQHKVDRSFLIILMKQIEDNFEIFGEYEERVCSLCDTLSVVDECAHSSLAVIELIIDGMMEPRDLDANKEKKFLEILHYDGVQILKQKPEIFLSLFEKFPLMMPSERYAFIFQKVSEMHEKHCLKPVTGPFNFLASRIERNPEVWCADKHRLCGSKSSAGHNIKLLKIEEISNQYIH